MADKGSGWLIIAIFVVLGLWSYNLLITCLGLTSHEPNLYGDSFGAVNALFSGITLAFLVYGIYLQRKELDQQKDELAESRKQKTGTTVYLLAGILRKGQCV